MYIHIHGNVTIPHKWCLRMTVLVEVAGINRSNNRHRSIAKSSPLPIDVPGHLLLVINMVFLYTILITTSGFYTLKSGSLK